VNSLYFLLVSHGLKAFLQGREMWEGEAQHRWGALAEALITEVFTVHGAVARIAATYFRGRTPLFPAQAEQLAASLQHAEQVVTIFNDHLDYLAWLRTESTKGSKGGTRNSRRSRWNRSTWTR
jgi:hypothetical protein